MYLKTTKKPEELDFLTFLESLGKKRTLVNVKTAKLTGTVALHSLSGILNVLHVDYASRP